MDISVNYYISKAFRPYMLANHALRSHISHVGYDPIIQNPHIPFICEDCLLRILACRRFKIYCTFGLRYYNCAILVSQVLSVPIGSSVLQMCDFDLLNFNCSYSIL